MNKKVLAVLMSVMMVFSVMSVLVYAQTIKAGDVTGDEKVTAADARRVLRVAATLETFDETQILAADINGDGKITAADARKILRAAATLEILPEITTEIESETEDAVSIEQKLIYDSVDLVLKSELFADCQKLYKEFMCEEPKTPEIVDIVHYQIDDFDGAKMNCYLVHISADVAYWINKDAGMGAVDDGFYAFIDCNSNVVYDSISTDALNCEHDTTTEQGRATYLMWMYDGMLDGSGAEQFVNDSETVIKLSDMTAHR